MCGLVAALLAVPKLSEERMTAALATIAHRGPDRMALWLSPDRRMALGHVRLSIIGLINGDQPLVNATGDVSCVVNGEFYTYRSIRARLASEGTRFATDSDSEIALHLYQQRGMEFVHDLRGEFALVIADQRRRCLIAVRDRFGIKPLFYAVRGGDVLVASEVKALLALGVPGRWDMSGFLASCHAVRPSQQTIFGGIRALPPGCVLYARDGQVDIRSYWDMEYPTRDALATDRRTDAEVIAGFRAALDDAVGERLVADVEVACYLSGGIDSCAVLGLAQRKLGRPIRAFTIAFGDELYNEQHLAEATAAFVGAKFTPVPVTQTQIADSFADALWHAEHPMANGNGTAKFLLSKAVQAAGIRVVFTGEGADEILAGYPWSRRDLLLFNSEDLDPTEARRLVTELDGANLASRGIHMPLGDPGPGLEVVQSRLGFVPSWIQSFSSTAAKLRPLLHDQLAEMATIANPYAELLDTIDLRGRLHGRDPVNQSLYLWNRTMLVNAVLTFLGDRMEMAHSVEGRVPFLDHRVAEFAAGLPVRHKIRGMREKHVLREAVRDVVIPEVYARQKHPFVAPPPQTQDDAMSVLCQDVLRSSHMYDQPFFDPARVRAWMDRVATLEPAERAGLAAPMLVIASTCILQRRFGLAA
jgi:asparagine synthase (glutamine-hydrolysing)